jgi:4'-phosphopantetheinyl transferase
LFESQVDIFYLNLELYFKKLDLFLPLLSADEIARANRFKHKEDGAGFIISHGFLRNILSNYLHIRPQEIIFSKNKYGKPLLDKGDVCFNLSHSKYMAAVAVSTKYPVGIDIEYIGRKINHDDIIKRFFCLEEVEYFQRIRDVEQKRREFFRLWTRKEAVLKAQGIGLSQNLANVAVLAKANKKWQLEDITINNSYQAAIAVDIAK